LAFTKDGKSDTPKKILAEIGFLQNYNFYHQYLSSIIKLINFYSAWLLVDKVPIGGLEVGLEPESAQHRVKSNPSKPQGDLIAAYR